MKIKNHIIFLSLMVYSASVFSVTVTMPVSEITIPGYVNAIEQSPDGHWLYAIVQHGKEPGIYVFDAREPIQLKVVNKVPLRKPVRMRITHDGRSLYILNYPSDEKKSKVKAGLHLFDLSNPVKPKKVSFVQLDATTLAVSPDETLLATNIRHDNRPIAVRIFDMTLRSELKILAEIPVKEKCSKNNFHMRNMVISKNPYTLYTSYNKYRSPGTIYDCLQVDLSKLEQPVPVVTFDYNWLSARKYYRYSYGLGKQSFGGRFHLNIHDEITRGQSQSIGELFYLPEPGSYSARLTIQESIGRALIGPSNFSSKPDKLRVVDISNPKAPNILEEHFLAPKQYVLDMLLSKDLRYVYLTGKDGVRVYATAQGGVNVPTIIRTHRDVMESFKIATANGTLKDQLPIFIATLEHAGVQHLGAGSPSGITNDKRAHILNDYAHFLRLSGRLEKSIEWLNIAVQLQPQYTVAQLNLAEAYFDSIKPGDSNGKTEDIRNKITFHYRAYQRLSKRNNNKLDVLVSEHTLSIRPSICQYISEQTNLGQLNQIAIAPGWMDINGDDKMERTEIGHAGGTMGGELLHIYDEFSESITLKSDESDEKNWTFGTKLVPYAGKYYIVNMHNELSSSLSHVESINSENKIETVCSYNQEVKEEIAEAKDPELCKSALDGSLEYVPFNESHDLTQERLKRWSTYLGKAAVVDINNDNVPENIIEIEYSSGAARGCSFKYFDILNPNRNDIDISPLRELLLLAQEVSPGSGDFTPSNVPSCNNARFNVVKYQGKYYLEGKYDEMRKPATIDAQFHRVVLIDKNKQDTICIFRFKTINK